MPATRGARPSDTASPRALRHAHQACSLGSKGRITAADVRQGVRRSAKNRSEVLGSAAGQTGEGFRRFVKAPRGLEKGRTGRGNRPRRLQQDVAVAEQAFQRHFARHHRAGIRGNGGDRLRESLLERACALDFLERTAKSRP